MNIALSIISTITTNVLKHIEAILKYFKVYLRFVFKIYEKHSNSKYFNFSTNKHYLLLSNDVLICKICYRYSIVLRAILEKTLTRPYLV